MNTRLTTMSAAAIAIALVVAGCGGGGDDSTSGGTGTASAENRAAFAEQASTMCERAREQASSRIETYEIEHRSDGQSPAALSTSAFRAGLLGTINAEIEGVGRAAAATGYGPGVDTLIPEMRATFSKIAQDEKLSIAEIEDAFGPTDEMLRKYGITACSKSD